MVVGVTNMEARVRVLGQECKVFMPAIKAKSTSLARKREALNFGTSFQFGIENKCAMQCLNTLPERPFPCLITVTYSSVKLSNTSGSCNRLR